MKKYLIIILTFLIFSRPSLILAQEYTTYDGPSDSENEIENEGNYTEDEEGNYEIQYIETRSELDPSIFENIEGSEEEIKEKYKTPEYFNYKSWQFWFLILILFLILFILIRLFKKLFKINKEIKRHENYMKEIKTKKKKKISEKDEIIYSEPQED